MLFRSRVFMSLWTAAGSAGMDSGEKDKKEQGYLLSVLPEICDSGGILCADTIAFPDTGLLQIHLSCGNLGRRYSSGAFG